VLGAAAADKAGFGPGAAHDLGQVDRKGQADAAGAGLKREIGLQDARRLHKACSEVGDQQPVGGAGDGRRTGNDFGRVADARDHHHLIDVVAFNLPRGAGKGLQRVGHHNDVVGVLGVGQGKAEGAAGRRPAHSCAVAKGVGRRRGDDGDVDVHLTVLNGPVAAAVGAQMGKALHTPLGSENAKGSVQTALDVVNQP
jgi:hypothetical protein